MDRIVKIASRLKCLDLSKINNLFKIILLLWIFFESTFIVFYIKNSKTYNLSDCFLSIENFITVRQRYNESTNEFELKTYARSYSSPYLIELIQNSRKDCLCCP